ncbi:germinal-center associated nuclear protein-like [Phascolarctos cinereus]
MGVDHPAAIKECSRSSAGLEELLPHDLRPLAVLNMTMGYLVTHILDQEERNYQDWYSFVWSRTRGIRKDILQQHLHDPQTVSLMEKCARFHIHCAHHLCEEPISSFDAPTNKAQITKCLFALKEMYLDLASEGKSSRREAEFQASAILLALDQGDVLRQVRQLQPQVRNAPEVKFALQAFTALDSNNYVRFFKLVREASYLNACLLHGYFSQARGNALRAMTATHTVSSQKTTGFPMDRVVGWLLFNDSREAVSFMHHNGLHVSEGYVELNRQALMEPKQPFRPKRSIFILEKLTTSVGEVVNGEMLPAAPQHIPENSFSPGGEYIGDRAEMVIASCWKSTHVDMADNGMNQHLGKLTLVSPSRQRTEKRFLDPQESVSAASFSFLPFMDLELPIIKRQHVFPRLDQNEKIKENILQNEEEWKIENRSPKELGWKGEDESRKEEDDEGWLEMQEWEGEYSERWEGQNGEVRKDKGKEDRDECDKQGARTRYGSGHVQENRKREQGKEKEGRTQKREHKYDKIWEGPDKQRVVRTWEHW